MTILSKYQPLFLVLALLGFASVFGAFFVDHSMQESCIFNLSTKCPIMMGAVGEAIHYLEVFGAYFGGLSVSPLILLVLATVAAAYLARGALQRLLQTCVFVIREFETRSIPATETTLLWCALQNKRAPHLISNGRSA